MPVTNCIMETVTSHCVGRTLTAIDEVNKLLRLKADGILKCKDEFQSSTKYAM